MTNHTIYFDKDSEELFGSVEGKGTLINELIKEYFSNDEDTLRRKVERLEQEFNALTAKLKLKVEQRLEAQEKVKVVEKQSKAQIERKKTVDKHKEKFANGKITEDEYWEFFDKR